MTTRNVVLEFDENTSAMLIIVMIIKRKFNLFEFIKIKNPKRKTIKAPNVLEFKNIPWKGIIKPVKIHHIKLKTINNVITFVIIDLFNFSIGKYVMPKKKIITVAT